MSLSATVTAGKRFTNDELVDNAKLNQMAVPTVMLTGAADASQVGASSVGATKAIYGPWFYCTDSGAPNAHTLTAYSGATALPTSLSAGMEFSYAANQTNTGAVTIDVGGIGAVALKKLGSLALIAGDIRAGQMIHVRHDGTQFQMLNSIGNSPSWDRYATSGGSATAYTATFDPPIIAPSGTTVPPNGARVLVKWHATNTSTATFQPDSGLDAKAIVKPGDVALTAGDLVANQVSQLVYDNTLAHWVLTSPTTASTRTTVPVRQTVLSCSVDGTTGLPNFLTYGSTSVSLQNCDTEALVIAFAYGSDASGAIDYVARITANASNAWAGLSGVSSTYYLYVDRDPTTGAITYGSTTTRPVYTTAIGTGVNTYIISTGKMVNGSSTAIQRVFIGEAATGGGGTVTSVTAYVPMGVFKSGADQSFNTTANTDQSFTETHQIGLVPRIVQWVFVCQGATIGYSSGDEVPVDLQVHSTGLRYASTSPTASATTLMLRCAFSSLANPYLLNKGSYVVGAMDMGSAKWKLRAYAWRGW